MIQRFIETALLGFLGGFLFNNLNLPLPWILGSLTFVMLWQGFTHREAYWPNAVKNIGLIILGLYFGLYFTISTFLSIGPYVFPFLFVTCILIFSSIAISMTITKWINVDDVTSVFGSIPGGLSEMVIASEALHANSSYVVIFQTVRLLTVLFVVPSVIILFFTESSVAIESITTPFEFGWNVLWFSFPALLGVLIRNKIPAGIVIGPLVLTALMNLVLNLATIPELLLIAGQLAIGIGLGKNISFADVKAGGKYSLIYFSVSLILICLSFLLGAFFSLITSLDLATAMLSVAPGGLIEMVLTAATVGADPAIVSALQLTRILVILVAVPPFLSWFFRKRSRTNNSTKVS
ncbi:AbrB family transcriptional regulator [Halalkalibacter urbisdiaboli]|uniref:AbrB family transcriptional regulator n=1 Tax=Halalkalibacter urbisdiaboli TaxID=1960589 RepID=UPI000B43CE53|nr:AbrB family transcriptional regulator [Halalkalibacter urbisdiaboli]